MGEQIPEEQKKIAVRIAEAATTEEKAALTVWIERLMELKISGQSIPQKTKQAIIITADSKVIIPTLKIIARESKRLAWDERTTKGRLGIGGALTGIALFGGQGAGIAALGTAIGVPLWVVFGAGAAFVGVLYEEITGKNVKLNTIKPDPKPKAKRITRKIKTND